MRTSKVVLWATGAMLIFTACKGDDGPTGPAGVPNMTSKTVNGAALTWTDEVALTTNYKVASVTVPEITDDVIDRGAVMVYATLPGNGPKWNTLPYTYRLSNDLLYIYGVAVGKGVVQIRFHRSDNVVPGKPSSEFKIVVIPPTTAD